MRRKKTQMSEPLELNMTPLIDMIFILLIFFMVSSSFVRESGVEVERPVAKTASSKAPSVVVAVDSGNVIWIEGRSIDIRQVRIWMSKFRSDTPDGGVVIAADTMARSGIVIQVLDACREAGIRNVSVAAKNS